MSAEPAEEQFPRHPDTDRWLSVKLADEDELPLPFTGLITLPLSPLDELAADNQNQNRKKEPQ